MTSNKSTSRMVTVCWQDINNDESVDQIVKYFADDRLDKKVTFAIRVSENMDRLIHVSRDVLISLLKGETDLEVSRIIPNATNNVIPDKLGELHTSVESVQESIAI
jgi:hypothetical protein